MINKKEIKINKHSKSIQKALLDAKVIINLLKNLPNTLVKLNFSTNNQSNIQAFPVVPKLPSFSFPQKLMLPPKPKIMVPKNDNINQPPSISCSQITNPEPAHLNIGKQLPSMSTKVDQKNFLSPAMSGLSMTHDILNPNINVPNNSFNISNLFGQGVLNQANKVPSFHEGAMESNSLKDISKDNLIINESLREGLTNNLNLAGTFVQNKFSNINENLLLQLLRSTTNDSRKLLQSIMDPQKSMEKLYQNELINLLANQTSKLLEQQISKQFSKNNDQIHYDNLLKEVLQKNEKKLEINSLLLQREINDRARAIDDQNQFRISLLKKLKSSNVTDDNLKINLNQNLSSNQTVEAQKKLSKPFILTPPFKNI